MEKFSQNPQGNAGPIMGIPSLPSNTCPIWVDGFIAGRVVRKSLATADWQKAQDFVREWEAQQSEPKASQEPLSIQAAG
jgi:hypothetical protein